MVVFVAVFSCVGGEWVREGGEQLFIGGVGEGGEGVGIWGKEVGWGGGMRWGEVG